MTKTSEQDLPTQVHLRGNGGVITFDLPLNEHVQRQWDTGELTRVNADGTPYTGKASRRTARQVGAADPHINLDDYQRIVAEAETEAAEAEALAAALAERVRDGDESITPAELESAEQLGRFAKLRKTAAARKAERAREDERQRLLVALREEIEAASPTSRAALAELLKTAEDAILAFVAACEERNTTVRTWHQRMLALGVPTLTTPQPPAEHQFMAHAGSDLLVGEYPPKRFSVVSPGGYVDQLCNQTRHGVALDPTTYESLGKDA